MDILSRVPAKTVGKCRCVSKLWNSLLCEPQFIKDHCNKTQKLFTYSEESLLSFKNGDCSLYSTRLKNAHLLFDETSHVNTNYHFFTSASIDVTACCNGLILVLDGERWFTLINPATKQVKVLPSLGDQVKQGGSIFLFGIGYDSVSDDYKVAVIFRRDTKKKDELRFFYVYSVRNGTWKQAQGCPTFPHHYTDLPSFSGGVCFDGYIYWVANSILFCCSPIILAFDLHEEKFRQVQRLGSLFDAKDFTCARIFGGYFPCLGVSLHSRRTNIIDFWKIEQCGVKESWTKFSTIYPEHNSIRPICFTEKEQVLLLECVRGQNLNATGVVVSNTKDKTFKSIVVHDVTDYVSVQQTFIESLVSPHCRDEGARKC